MKKRIPKIALRRETLRVFAASELKHVVGAAGGQSDAVGCPLAQAIAATAVTCPAVTG